jgi:hypothetical protein
MKKNKLFPLKSRRTQGCTLPTLIQFTVYSYLFTYSYKYSAGIPSESNRVAEGNKRDSNSDGRSQIIPI